MTKFSQAAVGLAIIVAVAAVFLAPGINLPYTLKAQAFVIVAIASVVAGVVPLAVRTIAILPPISESSFDLLAMNRALRL